MDDSDIADVTVTNGESVGAGVPDVVLVAVFDLLDVGDTEDVLVAVIDLEGVGVAVFVLEAELERDELGVAVVVRVTLEVEDELLVGRDDSVGSVVEETDGDVVPVDVTIGVDDVEDVSEEEGVTETDDVTVNVAVVDFEADDELDTLEDADGVFDDEIEGVTDEDADTLGVAVIDRIAEIVTDDVFVPDGVFDDDKVGFADPDFEGVDVGLLVGLTVLVIVVVVVVVGLFFDDRVADAVYDPELVLVLVPIRDAVGIAEFEDDTLAVSVVDAVPDLDPVAELDFDGKGDELPVREGVSEGVEEVECEADVLGVAELDFEEEADAEVDEEGVGEIDIFEEDVPVRETVPVRVTVDVFVAESVTVLVFVAVDDGVLVIVDIADLLDLGVFVDVIDDFTTVGLAVFVEDFVGIADLELVDEGRDVFVEVGVSLDKLFALLSRGSFTDKPITSGSPPARLRCIPGVAIEPREEDGGEEEEGILLLEDKTCSSFSP